MVVKTGGVQGTIFCDEGRGKMKGTRGSLKSGWQGKYDISPLQNPKSFYSVHFSSHNY